MKHVEKIAYKEQKARAVQSQHLKTRIKQDFQHQNNQRVLDGFLILDSCKIKMPYEAIRSKLSGMNIVDCREEDLVYFKDLKYLDLSENSVHLHQLVNLVALEELDL